MKQSVIYFILSGIAFPCQQVMAESFWDQTLLVAGLEVGHKSQQLGELLDNRLNFYILSGSLQATYQDYYLGMNLSSSVGDTDIIEDGEVGSAYRSDIDIVLGWYTSKNITVFAGYKHGKTILDLLTREDENSDEPQIPFRNTFEEKGPYFGIAYTHRMSQAGQITFSLAYALLEAINSLENANADQSQPADELDFDDLQGVYRNDADGFSLSMKWTIPVAQNIYYTSLLRYNQYTQEIAGDIGGNHKVFNVDETFIDINIGFLYLF